METKNLMTERDRESTEKRLLETIGKMINEQGFEKMGINAVATQSGVSKILIYRYFGSLDGLIATYIRQQDFWLNFPQEIPGCEQLPDFLKQMFHQQIDQLRTNPTLKRLYRWELSTRNEIIIKLWEQREKAGLQLIEKISTLTDYPPKQLAAMATVLATSITHLVMLEEFCPVYNGISLNEPSGWEQIKQGIDILIDQVFKK